MTEIYLAKDHLLLETGYRDPQMPETVDGFEEGAWYALVDHVMVYGRDDVRFTFKNGMEIKV